MKRSLISTLLAFGILSYAAAGFAQGSLTPPGAPAPTMKTLDQVEPRTRIPGGSTPYLITNSGSYYLSGNLSISSGDAITIAASNVTLDLGGFELLGSGLANSGIAIEDNRSHVTIRNGTIRNFPNGGIDGLACAGVCVEQVRAVGNGYIGISVGDDAAVINCLTHTNYNGGISVGNNSVIRDCQSIGNTSEGSGFSLGSGGLVTGCTARLNSGNGFAATDNCLFERCVGSGNTGGHGFNVLNRCSFIHCTATDNSAPGIEGYDDITVTATAACGNGSPGIYIDGGTITGCTVNRNATHGILNFGAAINISHCDVSYNSEKGIVFDAPGRIEGCTLTQNGMGGISVTSGSVILNNTCHHNSDTGFGIEATGADNRVEGNNLTGQGTGLYLTSAGNLVIRNSATGNSTNYNIIAGNTVGPTVTSGTIATSTNPHANYDF